MAEFKGYYKSSSFAQANMTEIGIVSLDDMGTLPFYSVHYKGKQLSIESEEKCQGSCLKFAQKYLEIKWVNVYKTGTSWEDWEEKKYVPRVCEAEDITAELFGKGYLYLCPPKG